MKQWLYRCPAGIQEDMAWLILSVDIRVIFHNTDVGYLSVIRYQWTVNKNIPDNKYPSSDVCIIIIIEIKITCLYRMERSKGSEKNNKNNMHVELVWNV